MSRGVTELGSRDELVTADMDIDITDSEPEFRLPGAQRDRLLRRRPMFEEMRAFQTRI